MNYFEKEEMQLEQQLEFGEITQSQFNLEMKELQRSYRDQARESAQQAYDDELDRW